MNIKLSKDKQWEVLKMMNNLLTISAAQSTEYRDMMLSIYEALSTMELPDTWDNLTRFKINKAHEVLRKVVPRVVAKPPRFIVTPRTDIFFEWDEEKVLDERSKMLQRNNKFAWAVRDYLHNIFEDQNFKERLKVWAINMLTYGNSFAQVVPKFKIQRKKWKNWVEERVVGVLPTIDPVSWTEMHYDARYKFLDDMPGIVRRRKKVPLFSIFNDPDYFNLDETIKLSKVSYKDDKDYESKVYQMTWVKWVTVWQWFDENNATLEVFEWYYSLTWKQKDAKLYRFTSVWWAVLIWAKEITELSFVDMKWHEDPEVFYSVWLIAPILGITDELNFQKNAQATAISKSLNRSYWYAPESGVDPAQLFNDKAGNIIVCNNGVEAAQRNVVEIQDNQLPSQYFSNVNDYNRDIQTLTHTTDVSQPWWSQAITNTATWARISFFESNAVIAELRKNFERAVQELAYKILDWTANNIDKDIVIKKANSSEFLKINIAAIRDAIERYDIIVEANSSSFDDLENRRADAIALKNILIEAKNSEVWVNMEEWFRKVFSTFENIDIDKLLPEKKEEVDIMSILWGQEWWNIPQGKPAPKPQQPTSPEWLTEAVAWWTLFQ